jgi:serine/threonine protein kinase
MSIKTDSIPIISVSTEEEDKLDEDNTSDLEERASVSTPSHAPSPTSGGYQPNDFKILQEVGEGSFGRVYLCTRIKDKKQFAIKSLDKNHLIKVRPFSLLE